MPSPFLRLLSKRYIPGREQRKGPRTPQRRGPRERVRFEPCLRQDYIHSGLTAVARLRVVRRRIAKCGRASWGLALTRNKLRTPRTVNLTAVVALCYPNVIRIILVAITVTQAGCIVAWPFAPLPLRDRSNPLAPCAIRSIVLMRPAQRCVGSKSRQLHLRSPF
jgi:hypothetical protein